MRFRGDVTPQQQGDIHAQIGAQTLRAYQYPSNLVLVRIDPLNLANALNNYAARGEVLYAEPDYQLEFFAVPNDTHFAKQWGLRNTGQFIADIADDGLPLADIRATKAWDEYTGAANPVTIAVIDSGIAYDHPDIAPNMWTNPGESGGGKETNGIDDDGNTYIDDVYGYDFFEPDSNPHAIPDVRGTVNYHGTHVAGIIGARGNNSLGVTGVNWDCRLAALKVGGTLTTLDESAVIAALNYCINKTIKISNNSYGGSAPMDALRDTIEAARVQIGHLFIAAAGNSGLNIDASPVYPAAYTLANIISVAATDGNDLLGVFPPLPGGSPSSSNYGLVAVDLGAPGVSIHSTWQAVGPEPYHFRSGTSQATPFVTGVAALVHSRYPALTYTQIKNQIEWTPRKINSLNGKVASGGVLNAYAAIADCNSNGMPDAQEISGDTEFPWLDCDNPMLGNGNWILDSCELPPTQGAVDCNGNGVADSCDIKLGTLTDCLGDGIPDTNECQPCAIPNRPVAENSGTCFNQTDCLGSNTCPVGKVCTDCVTGVCYTPKNRYLSFSIPTPCDTRITNMAVRVKFVALPASFSSFVGTKKWVGAPITVTEVSSSSGSTPPPTFKASEFTCSPVYRAWNSDGLIHLSDNDIVPGAVYEVQAIASGCDTTNEANYSAILTLRTPKWGDLVRNLSNGVWLPPNGIVEFHDIQAVQDKFQNQPTAVIKARADIDPNQPNRMIDFQDIGRAVDAFKGIPYPTGWGPDMCPP